MQTGAIREVVIVGGGTAGWMSAAFLSRVLRTSKIKITLIESAEIGTVGVGEATIPPINFFNTVLGINEADFMRKTQASIKLGIEFEGWVRDGQRYIHPFGAFGSSIEGVSFHSFWLRAQRAGKARPLEAYSLCAVAAAKGRFRPPNKDPRSPESAMAYAYHFDAGLYAQYLRAFAEARGVKRIDSTIKGVELSAEDGGIDHVVLNDGRTIKGDFFLDCSGFRALLLGQALGVDYHDWSSLLPANRAVAVPDRRVSDPVPYTKSTARKAGWQWRIPLQHRTGNGYVYVSDFISDDEAASTLLANLQGEALAEPRFLRFTTGRRHQSRLKNCVAIGLSSGFLEPLESTSIHLIQHGLIKLAATFPMTRVDEASSKLYNQIMSEEMEQIRDFIILHYHANQRVGEPLWDYVRNMTLPESLSQKIELFRTRGQCIFPNQTVFQEANWLAVMMGQGIEPQGYDPVADMLDDAAMYQSMEKVRQMYAQIAESMPPHDVFLRQYCPAQEMAF